MHVGNILKAKRNFTTVKLKFEKTLKHINVKTHSLNALIVYAENVPCEQLQVQLGHKNSLVGMSNIQRQKNHYWNPKTDTQTKRASHGSYPCLLSQEPSDVPVLL